MAALVVAASCGPIDHGAGVRPPRTETTIAGDPGGGSEGRPSHARRIDDEAVWSALAARPETNTASRTEVVKLLIDLADEQALYFIDTERYPLHYEFARAHLDQPGRRVSDHATFNRREYRAPDRRFILASLVRYLDRDLTTFELVAGDTLDAPRLIAAFTQVRDAVHFGEALRFRPLSLAQEALAASRPNLPTVTTAEVFAGLRYQPLTLGVAIGTLRFVEGALDEVSVRPDEILVLARQPEGLPVVGGVITAELQAPLGHVALLCRGRGTPNMGLRGAMTDQALRALEGQLVRLEVGGQDFAARAASREEAEAHWASIRPTAAPTLRLSARDPGLRDVCQLRLADLDTAGAKAAQLGEACRVASQRYRTPEGFAVPFAAYLEHLMRSGAGRGLAGMLGDRAFREERGVRATRLAELRAIIERTAVQPALLQAVRQRIAALPPSRRVILRSSTNAEDLPGFSGAGLYRSVVIARGATDVELADAIRVVYASVWALGAFEEREWHRIDHRRVAMAILVQPFVDGAAVNGVTLTQNPFYQARPAFFINAQPAGGSVTGAAGDEVPEQHLVYTYSAELEFERLGRSSRSRERDLLSLSDLEHLSAAFELLHTHFLEAYGEPVNAVDVEWLLVGPQREVVILQARPFVVRWSGERAWH